MRIALCQLNPTVGDLDGNAAAVVEAAAAARARGADLAVCPELTLCGYPPRDLLDRPSFVRDGVATLETLATRVPHDLPILVGCVDSEVSEGHLLLFNAAALLEGGRVRQVVRKQLLPTYDVFDEARYFRSGNQAGLVEVAGQRVGVTICEDVWYGADAPFARPYHTNPVQACVAAGAQLIVNLSASPFTLAKRKTRGGMLAAIAAAHRVPVVFVNQVGGNDDLIFDGASAVFAADGRVLSRCPSFEATVQVADVMQPGEVADDVEDDASAALDALVLGVRDYARKTGFASAVLGLSGGIDSALVACIAAEALGPQNVLGVAMPTRYSSQHSLDDAQALASQLGLQYRVVPIEPLFEGFSETLVPLWADLAGSAAAGAAREDVSLQNLQARIRGVTLMSLSNRFDYLLLTTGNKSEVAVGYCTLYGDMAGGLAVISDLPKTFVYRVAREVNRRAGRFIIPESTLTKPPSAELRPDQTDQDSLPDYEVLDAILQRYVEQAQSQDEIVAAGFDADTVARVVRMVRLSEYKRRQMPPGLIVTGKAFGPGRRYPIAQGYRR